MRRGLVDSREQAKELIAAGQVLVSGAIADKPARQVAAGEPVELRGPKPRFVSRGGEKLDAALDRFPIAIAGQRALDAGASTGGFTDCLLQRGAAHVTAVDVGHSQLHERLRHDPRVAVHERTHIRDFVPEERYPLIVADLSFISLRAVAPDLAARLAAPGADLVLLIKPQYEAGRAEAARNKGIVKDPATWRRVLEEVVSALEAAGAAMMDAMVSPLKGADGNVEFLGWFRVGSRSPAGGSPVDLDALVAEAEARG
jgi:23S rRNA (cytidine1920-2'-O)/16S rRNA (cytidine1409-2'-O)-methyltransferase